MPAARAVSPTLTASERHRLNKMAYGHTIPHQARQYAAIALPASRGCSHARKSAQTRPQVDTVRTWRGRCATGALPRPRRPQAVPTGVVRAILAVAAGALAPALLLSTPSLADAKTRSTAAAASDTGSPYDEMDADDLRIAILRILADPGISDALRTAANAALGDSTPEALRYFLEVGQYEVDG